MKKIVIILSLLLALSLGAEHVTLSNLSNQISLIESGENYSRLQLQLGSFEQEQVLIDGADWYLPTLAKAGITLKSGLPQVPVMAASVIIPATALMQMEIVESEYIELKLPIAPSKGNLTRDIDPATIPFTFADFYQGKGSYPEDIAYLSEPFILRDFRGITARFQPFVYYPATGITRIYTKIVVEIRQNGIDQLNTMSAPRNGYAPEFRDIYENMFLNFADTRYPSLDEEGRILVITHSMFNDAIQPWVDWKRQIGYTVDVVDVNVAGPSAANIKTYVQNEYNLDNGLKFLQIMGDAPQVPSLSSGGGGSDPSYALLAGNDNYPDIYVGRFSAQTVAEMDIQIEKTIFYERDAGATDVWAQKAMGIASNEGGGGQGDNGESDQQHMEIIRGKLLTYGYTSVDQVYQAQGATASQVTNYLNEGRGFINYVGHGSDTSWVTTGFNNNNVNALTNDYKLPVIASVACVNGNFVSQTCFAEAWLRAKNNSTGNPTGAAAMYASSVNQGWAPPMRAQDEITDLLVLEAKSTIGGIFYNGSSKMIEVYGTTGASEYKNWHIFGDASMMMRSKTPTELAAIYEPVLLIGMNSLLVQSEAGARMTLSANGVIYGKAIADNSGSALISLNPLPAEPMDLTLTIVAYNKITHLGTVQVLPADGAYLIVTGINVNSGNPVNYGEVVNVQIDMENVGNDPAEMVSVSLCTEDPYLLVAGEADLIPLIAANSTGSTIEGVDLQVSASAPNQYEAFFNIQIELESGEIFTKEHSFIINAPEITFGYLYVDDSMGNGNNRIDPGETFILSIPLNNTGNATSPELNLTLMINGGDYVINPILNDFPALEVGGYQNAMNEITFSSMIEPGTNIEILAMLTMGEYTVLHTYNVVVGILLENFENGFGNFPWNFLGGNWTIESGGYMGGSAAKSANIGHYQSTSMTITMQNPADGFVSFWKKVSSESGRDYFKFYINDVLKNQWSGEDAYWTQVSFMVNAGTNIYRWEYVKDGSVSGGNDCVLIDDVIFPAEDEQIGSPTLVIDQTNLDFGDIPVDTEAYLPFTISNTGTNPMIGTLEIPAPYYLGMAEDQVFRFMNYVLQPDESLELSIGFAPTAEGIFTGFLVVTSDDPNAHQISIPLMGSASPVSNDDPVAVVNTALKGNYPNPFNPETTVSFALKQAGEVRIEIYNILGQKVKTLIEGNMNAGNHNLIWKGTDDKGRPVASGIYFYKMQAGSYSATRKMIMMK